ncbi:hypothetical protein [Nocardiopsis sp. JB363]|uniref:hypothetical protein n=1 Tax=Nocardiopsis sp. JB363 TaxID=1434837 RepID=UPI000B34F822|nr:hypothetical protein [Nocardiopsis sp. JB363]
MRAMSESPPCRSLRAGVFTLVCASLSAIGHAVSSGQDVPLSGLLLGGALVWAMAWASTTRRSGLWALTARMLWGQFALHVTFSVAQGWGGGHGDHGVGEMAAQSMSAWAMIAMHVVMALMSAWWLRLGEDALFAFLGFMALSLVPLLLVVGALSRPEPVTAPRFIPLDRPLPAGPSVLRHTRVLRGPPVLLAA